MRKKFDLQNKITKSRTILLLFCLATLFIGIGYASINSVTLDIKGTAIAKQMEGIIITDVKYTSNNNANEQDSKINKYYQTVLDSSIVLSKTDTSSSITYEIVIYNNTSTEAYFDQVTFLDEFYDNELITYSLTGITAGDCINPYTSKSFFITFKYKEGITNIINNVLNSYLNFKFKKPGNMKSIGSYTYNGEFWNYRNSITKIIFQNEISNIENAIYSWDISQEQNKGVMAYLVLNKDTTTHTVYIQSNGNINAPENSNSLFYGFTKLETIENIKYLKTTKVTNMAWMFMSTSSLTTLDLSGFDTSNVTSMNYMFGAMTKLTNLDISSFNTEKVKDMAFMFYNTGLTSLDLSNFNTSNVTSMSYMFGSMVNAEELDLSSFNTSKVRNMNSMFSAMLKVTSLNLSSFDTSNVTDMGNMFFSCQKLKKLDLSSFDMSKAKTSSMLYDTGSVIEAYARTQEDADILNAIEKKPTTYTFTVL